MEQIGRIHSIETCGTVDGPGIRYVIFLQGCPLKCRYCHNPDTWNYAKGADMTVDELMTDMLKYQSYMEMSGGGVTVSGGEPLMQPDFLTVLFKECKKRGIHTALDTSGYASLDKVRPLLTDTDLVLLDIKSFSPEIFKEITGVPIQPVLAFADYLKEQEIPVWIRFVLVPGLSDSEENMQPLAAYLAEFQNIRQVDILPFHKMGEYKWEELGYEYHLTDTKPPDLQELSRVKKIFRDRGLKVP